MMNVLLTFDNFGEAYDLYRYGHAGGGVSDGVYAIRRGIPRVLSMLQDLDIRATFFVEGWGAHRYPELLREIVAAGHEVGAHGWLHEEWNTLTLAQETESIRRTVEAIGEVTGGAPVGWRSPWGKTTPATLALLADAGIIYDSSFVDDDVPYLLEVAADDRRTIVELPFTQMLNDTPFYSYPGGKLHIPEDVMAAWWSELEALSEEARFAVVTTHPRYSGRLARIRAMRGLIERLMKGELGPVRFLRCDEAAKIYGTDSSIPRYAAPAEALNKD